jgi:hypothetical protein
MATTQVYMPTDELITKILDGERDFPGIRL